MPIDFEWVSKKICMELDGIQHFEQVSNWKSPDNVQAKDIEKIHKTVQQGYVMIHLFQKEVWEDSYDWKKVLHDVVNECVANPTPRCIFISQSPERYQSHREKLDKSIPIQLIHP